MSEQWFYRLFGEEFGPVSREQVDELVQLGTLGDLDEVRPQQGGDWRPLAQAFAAATTASVAVVTASSSPDSADDEPNWFREFAGQDLGPLSFNELITSCENGEVGADDQVKFGATGKWRRVGSIGRLVAVLPYHDHVIKPPAVAGSSAVAGTPKSAARSQPEFAPKTEVSTPPAPTDPKTDRAWFSRIGGSEYGPSTAAQLQRWLGTGQLGLTDQVKLGPEGEWMPAGELVPILEEFGLQVTLPKPALKAETPSAASRADMPIKSASKSAEISVPVVTPPPSSPSPPPTVPEPVLSKPVAVSAPPPVAPPPPRPVAAPTSTYSPPPYTPPAAAQAAAQTVHRPAVKRSSGPSIDLGAMLGPLKDPKFLLGGLGAILGIIVVGGGIYFVLNNTANDRAHLEKLKSIVAQFRANREEKIGPNEWALFADKSLSAVKPMVDELKNTASRKYPARQNLLWAARDRLPLVLETAREKPNLDEQELNHYIEEADRILSGRPAPPPEPVAPMVGPPP